MKILDRYIAKGFLTYFLSSLIVFSSLYFLVDLLQHSVKEGLSGALITYGLLQLPYIISQMTPMACLIGSLFVLNSLSKNSELIAMHACGISLYRLSGSILVLASIIGIADFFISDLIVPSTLRQSRLVFIREIKGQDDYQLFKTHKLWHRSKNAIYNITYFNPAQNSLDGIDIYLFDDEFRLTEQILADRALYDEGRWTLYNGVSISFLDDFPVSHAFKTKEAEYIVEKLSDFKEILKLETMSFNELRRYIGQHKRAGFNTIRHEVNLHAKIAYAFACLVMAFLSIPFSAKNPRSGGFTLSSAMALGIAFFYWICLNAGLSFGYRGTLPPVLAAWITNIVFTALGFYLLRLQQRMKSAWLF